MKTETLSKNISWLFSLAILMALTLFASSAFAGGQAKSNQFWWPEQLDLSPLRSHDIRSNPYGENFNYSEEFKKLDLKALKSDIDKILTTSQDWWPADYGNYGPLFIRLAWHSAGTYRTMDGRGGAAGGQIRFDPLNSWPDNGNLDKAKRLLWPIKQKYGKSISWSDLMILTGNVAMENMGFKTLGFAGGREDDWEADFVYWGPEAKFLDAKRRGKDGQLEKPLAAVQMGLIYVNPQGPNGVPDPLLSAKSIRESFGRMAMNDEEIVALIAGGHTFGKAHGAHKPGNCVGAEPGGAAIEEQGFGWKNSCGKGHSEDSVTSGFEGAWTSSPAQWTTMYLDNLFNFEWKVSKSPAGAIQWIPTDESSSEMVPDAHIKDKFHAPIMFTTDLALKMDPDFRKVSLRFQKNPDQFEDAFARAWFKLTHRVMGAKARYVGADVPGMAFVWQGPIPAAYYKMIVARDIRKLKKRILSSGLSTSDLVRTAWASAASFRGSDMRGGANGARLQLLPQREWDVNDPKQLGKALKVLGDIRKSFNHSSRFGKIRVSMADMIVLGGVVAIEKAARDAGVSVEVPFRPGRSDVTQQNTDVKSFALLEPTADGFRNYYSDRSYCSPAEMLIDKASQLSLTVPEMTLLVGGMRSLDANAGGSKHGVFTDKPGTLSNDFFVNLLDISTAWKKSSGSEGIYNGYDRQSGKLKWTATSVDLIFGANSELRAVAEVYAYKGSDRKFIEDFVTAWSKVMNLDRFESK